MRGTCEMSAVAIEIAACGVLSLLAKRSRTQMTAIDGFFCAG